MTSFRRPAVRLGLVTVLAGALALVGAGIASAHNTLISTDPADGSTLTVAPATVTLTFDQPVQTIDPVVTVNGPDGSRWEGGAITVQDESVTATVNPLGPAGIYTIGYRILSNDGHPVSGDFSFTLATAGDGVANPAVAQDTSAGLPAWVWIGGAGVVVLIIVGFGIVSARRQTD